MVSVLVVNAEPKGGVREGEMKSRSQLYGCACNDRR